MTSNRLTTKGGADTRPAPTVAEHAVSVVFLASGAAGLIFEVAWFHRSGLIFGNSVWATSIVLSSFMGGLALGNALAVRLAHRVRRPLRTYAFLEIIVAVSGVVVTAGLPVVSTVLAPVNRALADTPAIVNLIRLVTAFGILVVPSTAMGATLPLLAGALCRWRPGLGRVLGRLYGWNTLGAVAGVLGAELVLIARFGVMGSAWAAGGLNLGVAGAALWISRRSGEHLGSDSRAGRVDEEMMTPRIGWRLLTAAFLAGFGLLALEVVWFRFLSMLVVTTTLAASLMLAVVLTGIGLGGLVASGWARRALHVESFLSVVAIAIAVTLVASYGTFQFVLGDARAWRWYELLGFAGWLTFPASVLSGVLFTQLGEALKREVVVEAKAVGWLALANTAGATAGPIVAAFLLLPLLGMERSLFVLAALYGAIGLLALPEVVHSKRRVASSALGVAVVLMSMFFPFGLMSDKYFARAAQPHTADGSEIVATREGTIETIFLTEQSWQGVPIYHRLVTNGFSMSATAVPGKRYMRQFVYLPMVLRQAPLKRVLVICYGVGVTAGAVRDVSTVESISVVEISRDIVGMSDRIYSPDDHPLRDPRVRLHLEDGRYFLETSDERFDLITGEPPPPLTPGTVNIYTAEYFQLIHDHLLEGGVATYWLPVARQEDVDHTAIVRAFCEAFEDCSLWNGTPTDLMLMGTRRATGPVSPAQFSSAWNDPALGPHLREAGFELPEQMGATFIGDASHLRGLIADAPPLVDDYPRRLWLSAQGKSPSPLAYLFDRGGIEFYKQVLDPMRARRLFETSAFIKRLWPEPLRERTLPFFEVQRIIDRVLIEGANSLGQIEDLHLLLTRTSLERLPYWLLGLGNHPILERVDSMPNDGTGQIEYVRGLRGLVNRDYSGAAAHFAQSIERGLRSTRPLLVYALCLAGDLDAARTVAKGTAVSNASQQHFWTWMDRTFGVRP